MLKRFLLLLAIGLFKPLALGSPPEAVAAALADVRTLDSKTAYYTRYFDLSNLPPADLELHRQVAAFWFNSLSTETYITLPRHVSPTLMAVDIRNYEWDLYVYGHLANADPYFHVQLTTTGKDRTSAAAPWLGAGIAELIAKTGSQVPIVRFDWFVNQTAVQEGREGHGYYDFLRLGKKEADFYRLVGANEKLSDDAKKEMFAAVAKSGVARHNRALKVDQGLNGGVYGTIDYKASADLKNTINLINGNAVPPKGDAREFYGPLANGLPAYALFNANGDRQNVAPPDIAGDSESPTPDKQVHVGLSCVRCHKEVLRPVDDFIRRAYSDDLILASPDFEIYKQLRRRYLTDLKGRIDNDRANFVRAIKACNGLSPLENAKAFATVFAKYEQEMTVADCARELGVTVERLQEAIRSESALKPTTVAVLAKAKPLPILREHWEEQQPYVWKLLGNKP